MRKGCDMDCESKQPQSAQVTSDEGRCAFPWQFMNIDLTGAVGPCNYWSMVSEQALGNTNVNTLAEIWNGDAFRELRRRHATQDLKDHPCAACPARRMLSTYPPFEWGDSFRLDRGHCYIGAIPDSFWQRHEHEVERIRLFEDGDEMLLRQALHDDIRELGRGRYSIWRGSLFLSTRDQSNPASNGRSYVLRCGKDSVRIASMDMEHPSGRNTELAHEEYLRGSTKLEANPGKLTFIETADCNIDCPSCSQNEVRRTGIRHLPSTNPQVMALLPTLFELTWHGGEPFMMPRFRRFVTEFDASEHPNLSFAFMSNGTMINEKEVEKLARFPRLNVTISMDSFVKETYEVLRAGANFDRVLANAKRLHALQDWPMRRLTIAMIVGKTGMPEVGKNVRFALEHDLRLMLNPITQFPVSEQLTVFEDFAQQSANWDAALCDAEAAVEEAARRDDRSLHFLDASSGVAELRRFFEEQARVHADCRVMEVEVQDPHGSLASMRRPALLVHSENATLYESYAYCELRGGAGRYVLRVPAVRAEQTLHFHLLADLFDVSSKWVPPNPLVCFEASERRVISVPRYTAPIAKRNAEYADLKQLDWRGGELATPLDALYAARAGCAGPGFEVVAESPSEEEEHAACAGPELEIAAETQSQDETRAGCADPGFESAAEPESQRRERARAGWSAFLPNYFRPFARTDRR